MEREARLRVGVIGAGLVVQAVHLPVLQRLDRHFAIAALAEPDAAVRGRVAARHGIARAYPDHQRLLEAGGLDVLLVGSPDATHARVTLDALSANVHVLVEKPLCLTLGEAAQIVAARDRAGRVVQVGYMKRFDPAVERLLSDLDEPPRHLATTTFDPGLREAFLPDGSPEEPPSRRGAFLGALIHDVNLGHAILERTGAAVEHVVEAFGDGRTVGATFVLGGGARWTAVWLSLPAAGTFREHVAVYGDGVHELEFPAPYLLHAPTTYRWTRGSGAVVHRSWDEAYERQLLHLHACVTRGEPCRTPPEQAVADLELLERCAP